VERVEYRGRWDLDRPEERLRAMRSECEQVRLMQRQQEWRLHGIRRELDQARLVVWAVALMCVASSAGAALVAWMLHAP